MTPPQKDSESLEDVLLAVAGGDQAAFGDLYDRVAGRVNGLTVRILRDRSQAEEVTQEVMIEIWRKATRFDPARGSGMGWILSIAHRRAVDRVRSSQSDRKRTEAHGTANQPVAADVTVEETIARLEAEEVSGRLAVLTELQREAILMAYWGGLTYVEVSEKLDVPLGTIKTRIRDGLRSLAAVLENPT